MPIDRMSVVKVRCSRCNKPSDAINDKSDHEVRCLIERWRWRSYKDPKTGQWMDICPPCVPLVTMP